MNSHLLIPKYPLPLGICSEMQVLEELKSVEITDNLSQ